MRTRIIAGRPSPAIIVAVTALVVAMSGVAAALPGKNTVDKNDLKKGAVRSKAIKNAAVTNPKLGDGAVTGSKLADGAVTGSKLADGSVTTAKLADGAVNGAKVADESLSDNDISDYQVLGNSAVRVVATEGASEAAAQAAAPETVLLQKPPFTLYAKCFRDTSGTGTLFGEIYARTSVDGAIQQGTDTLPQGVATDLLNVATPEESREFDTETELDPNQGSVGEGESVLIAPDLTAVHVNTYIAVKQGTLPTGDGAFGAGNVCLFGGSATG